jgi:hypothetical protein
MTFVGLWVYTIVDGCVCVFQWGSHAAAFSEAELLLPSLSGELSIPESCWRLRDSHSCVLRLVIEVFRLLLCGPKERNLKWKCNILHLVVNMPGFKGP